MPNKKALYKNIKTGNIFAIETDEKGEIVSSAGVLFNDEFDPYSLDFDNYFTSEIKAKFKDFILLTKDDYLEILRKNGFRVQTIQRHLF